MIASLRFAMKILKFLVGLLTGSGYQPGDSIGSVTARLPRPVNQRTKDKAKALEVANEIMRQAAEADRPARREEILNEIEVEDDQGRVVGLNLSRRGRK